MKALTTHNYNGFAISQDGDKYTSLTDMARACGKFVADYLRLDSTTEYLQELSMSMGLTTDQLVRIKRDGKNEERGTWAHPEVAIDFAQWCNVSFRIWANRTLRGVIEQVSRPDRQSVILEIETRKLHIEVLKLEVEKLRIESLRDLKAPKIKIERVYQPRVYVPKQPIELSQIGETDIAEALHKIGIKISKTTDPVSVRDLYRHIAKIRNIAKQYCTEVSDLTIKLCERLAESGSFSVIHDRDRKTTYLKAN